MGTATRVQNVPRRPVTKSLLILGGGFGLYGYMPAAIANGYEVTTLERYKDFLLSREELRNYICKLKFVSETSLDFNSFSAVVIARTPVQQLEILRRNSKFSGHYFLEKPLGADSQNHSLMLKFLRENQLQFSIAYLFRYLEWYRAVVAAMQSDCTVKIVWQVSPNPEESWKAIKSSGGGLLSYYGVHLLSLIVDLQISAETIVFSHQTDSLEISSMDKAKHLQMKIEYSDIPTFQVGVSSPLVDYSCDLISPFGPLPTKGVEDPRVAPLAQYLKDSEHQGLIENSIIHESRILNLSETIERIL